MFYITNFYCLLLLIVSFIGLFRFKRLSNPFKILSISVIVVFVFNIISQILIAQFHNNAPSLQVETITEFVFYALIYYFLIKNVLLKKVILIIIIGSVVFSVVNAIFLQPFNKVFPTNIYLPAQIMLAILSLLLFKQMLAYPLKVNITKQSAFWYNIATLFYATTMFLNLGLSNYLVNYKMDYALYYFWYFSLYLFHILIGIALLNDDHSLILKDA